MVSKEWLDKLNKQLRKEGIEQRRRPWEAIRRHSTEYKVSVDLSSDVAKEIFDWFDSHSRPGVHKIGSLYETVYFFDSAFWVVSVPFILGTVELNALECLTDMPDHIKNEIMSDPKFAWDYVIYWADCVDYGLEIDDLRKSSALDKFGIQLLIAGDQELRTAVSSLKENRPNPRAILTSRMAVEMFLKSFIALKSALTENQAKSIGHNLSTAFDKFIEASGYNHLSNVKAKLSVFPPIHDRYEEQSISLGNLWKGFAMAQSLGALIVREFTDRNTLQQVMPKQPL